MKTNIALALFVTAALGAQAHASAYQDMNPVEKSSFNVAFTSAATSLAPSASSNVLAPANRGVADVEQMRDEMSELELDLNDEIIKVVADVRQPALREWFDEVAGDKDAMKVLRTQNPGKQDLVVLVNHARKVLN